MGNVSSLLQEALQLTVSPIGSEMLVQKVQFPIGIVAIKNSIRVQ